MHIHTRPFVDSDIAISSFQLRSSILSIPSVRTIIVASIETKNPAPTFPGTPVSKIAFHDMHLSLLPLENGTHGLPNIDLLLSS